VPQPTTLPRAPFNIVSIAKSVRYLCAGRISGKGKTSNEYSILVRKLKRQIITEGASGRRITLNRILEKLIIEI
jgi:hypothetical protein